MKTASGFEFEIDKKRLDNMELLDAWAELEEDPANRRIMKKIMVLIFGKGFEERLYDHVRLEDGRVPAEAYSAEVSEIFRMMEQTEPELKK